MSKKNFIIAFVKTKVTINRRRHVLKAITWRIIGTLDTWLISWLLISNVGEIQFFQIDFDDEVSSRAMQAASYIAILELISKTILYYFHERLWYSFHKLILNSTALGLSILGK